MDNDCSSSDLLNYSESTSTRDEDFRSTPVELQTINKAISQIGVSPYKQNKISNKKYNEENLDSVTGVIRKKLKMHDSLPDS